MSIWLCSACARRRGTPLPPACTSATPVSSQEDSTPRMFIEAVYGGDLSVCLDNLKQALSKGLPLIGKNSLHVPATSIYSARPARASVSKQSPHNQRVVGAMKEYRLTSWPELTPP